MLRFLYFLIGLSLIFYSLFTANESGFISHLNGVPVKNSSLNNLPPGKFNIDLIVSDLPKNFIFRVDDCLHSLEVNGSLIKNFNFPYCDYSKVASISLLDHTSLPLNKITASVENHDGPGNFIPFLDRITYSRVSNYLIFAGGFFLITYSVFCISWSYHYFVLLLISLISRAIVAALLPLDFRSSDFSGHLEHALYVIKHFRIPAVSECWECYQPPVFYFLNAIFGLTFGIDFGDFTGLALFPLLLSFLTCIVSVLLFKTWISERKSAFLLVPFLLHPGTLSTEISFNNDSLVTLTSLLILLLGSIWFKTSKTSAFWIGSFVLPIGALSKLSIFAAAATWFLMLLAKKAYKKIIFSGLIAVLIVSPYFIYRSLTESKVEMIGNIGNLNSEMRIDVKPKTFYTLDVTSMIKNPFADPWVEGFHRQSFGEYAFLSSIFFEARRLALTPAQLSVGALILSLFATLICLMLSFRSLVSSHWPVFAAIVFQIFSLAANLVVHPFACCANFRFIAPVGILIGIAFAAILERQSKFVKFPIFLCTTFGMLAAWYSILTTKL